MGSSQKFLIFLCVKMNLREILKMSATKYCIKYQATVNNLMQKALVLFDF